MNKDIMSALGFDKELKLVQEGKCPFCGESIKGPSAFRDEISRKEYKISGLCQECQDSIFGVK